MRRPRYVSPWWLCGYACVIAVVLAVRGQQAGATDAALVAFGLFAIAFASGSPDDDQEKG